MAVEKMTEIKDLDDMAELNAKLMGQVYDDENLSIENKVKLWSMGTRNSISVRAEQRKTMMDLARMGMKPNEKISQLTFKPSDKD